MPSTATAPLNWDTIHPRLQRLAQALPHAPMVETVRVLSDSMSRQGNRLAALLGTQLQETSVPTPSSQQAAFRKIVALYDHLDEMAAVLQDKTITYNAAEQFPMVSQFSKNIMESLENILDAYTRSVGKNTKPSGNEARIIEREGLRIFDQLKLAVQNAKAITPQDVDPTSFVEWAAQYSAASSHGADVNHSDKKNMYNHLRTKRGPVQTSIYEQMQRLGPHHGGRTLFKVEDVLLATVDMMRQLREAGIDINLNTLPGKEARFEHFGFAPPEGHTAFHASAAGPKEELKPVEEVIRNSALNQSKNNN